MLQIVSLLSTFPVTTPPLYMHDYNQCGKQELELAS